MISRRFEDLLTLARADTIKELKRVDALIFSHDVDRSDRVEGKAWGRVPDSTAVICEESGLSTGQVLLPFSKFGGNSAHGAPILMNRAWLRSRLTRKLRLRDDGLGGAVLLYQGMLHKAQPSVVFSVGLPEALAVAARSLDIPVVEVLHGRGYANIPWGWDRRAETHLPTDVFALDERSTLTFQQLQPKGVTTHHVLDPWLQLFSEQLSQVHDEWRWPEGLDGGKRRIVVVSLQWGYAGDHGDYEQFEGILKNGLFPTGIESVIQRTADDTQWLFRLHPVQMHAPRYAWARRLLNTLEVKYTNVEWQIASRLPLPTLLTRATHHVTMLSGSSYEAAEMGVPTALLCPTARPGEVHGHWFQDLINKKYAFHVDYQDSDQLLEWIHEAGKREPLVSGSPITFADAISRVLFRSES